MTLRSLRAGALRTLSKRQVQLLRIGVVLGLLIVESAMSWVLTRTWFEPMMILALPLVPLAALAFYRLGRIEYLILAVILSAGLVNFFTLPTGNDSRIVISMVVAAGLLVVWITRMLVIEKQIWLKPSPINVPLLSFVVVSVIAYVWGNAFRDPLVYVWNSFPFVQLAALAVNIVLPLLSLLVSNQIDEVRWLRYLAWIMVGMGAIYIVLYYTYSFPLQYILNNGSSGLFAAWVVAIAYAMALFNRDLPVWQRGLLLALVAAWFYRDFVEGRIWLSGWVPIVGVLFVLTYLRSKQLFLVVLVLAVLYVGLDFDFFYQKVYVANVEEGGLQRLDLWRMSLGHVAKHPLFGMGPAGYAVYNMAYHPEDARSTHNNYFDILAQTGIIGTFFFLWLFAAFARLGLRLTRILSGQRNFKEAYAAAVTAGCAAAIVAMMLGDWVLPFAYNSTIAGFDHSSYTWILIGGLVALYHIEARTNKASTGSLQEESR
jgi:O-antigen ligase